MRKSPSIPTILNKNVSYIDSPASWVFYTFIWLFLRVILAGLGLSAKASWAIVNWIHGIISYVLFHWIMGTPFASDHEHESDLLTFWEQIDDQVLYTRARKFLTLFPIALFFIAVDSSGWDLAYFWINAIVLLITVIPKLPFMHRVRIFGINS
ncbi:ORM1-like protein 3 [Tritrichomonas musculus]|uniref:ORM1-like protein 3 n=1 Tax=Tritrichomonas musculus TaxID=1915356 RepID=A0ABR2JZ88_9EUKA